MPDDRPAFPAAGADAVDDDVVPAGQQPDAEADVVPGPEHRPAR